MTVIQLSINTLIAMNQPKNNMIGQVVFSKVINQISKFSLIY